MPKTTAESKVEAIFWRFFFEAHGIDPDEWTADRACEVCGGSPPPQDLPGECGNKQCPAFACPGCSTRWDELAAPCPGCGLTVEDVAQRIADDANGEEDEDA